MAAEQIINVEVETEATGGDGRRKSDWSDWQTLVAEEGSVINKDQIKREAISERGSENTDEVVFSDYVELFPGTNIKLPRKVEIRVFARSSKGHFGGGGRTHYRYTIPFVKIPG